jgi:serine/threonine protein kinase
VRRFGPVTEKDIENEANAVSALCTGAKCKYVVEVLKHGWLTKDHTYYFIDMECCIQTLEEFIRDIAKESQVAVNRQIDLAIPNRLEPAAALNELDTSVAEPTSMISASSRNISADPIEIDPTEPSQLPMPTLTVPDVDNSTLHVPSTPTFSEDEQIDWKALITVLTDIASGLIYIHKQKFVHRDLKPRNGEYR